MMDDPSKYIARIYFKKWRCFIFSKKLPLFFNYLFKYNFAAVPIFKKYLKIFHSIRKKELDICFLETCIEDEIIPSFIFKMKLSDLLINDEIRLIHRRTLKRLLEIEKRRRNDLVKELSVLRMILYKVIGDCDFCVCVKLSIKNAENLLISKKLCHITKTFWCM